MQLALIMQVHGMPIHLPEVLLMTQSRAFNELGRILRINHHLLIQIVYPVLISFMSITIFLYLSYIIIEGYSIVQLMETGREVSFMKILGD